MSSEIQSSVANIMDSVRVIFDRITQGKRYPKRAFRVWCEDDAVALMQAAGVSDLNRQLVDRLIFVLDGIASLDDIAEALPECRRILQEDMAKLSISAFCIITTLSQTMPAGWPMPDPNVFDAAGGAMR